MDSSLRILVLGYIVRGPLGGMAWHHLQYVIGMARLGHDVYFIEDSGDSPWCCYDPIRHITDADPTYGLAFAANAFAKFNLDSRWAYYDAHTSRWLGPCASRMRDICATADLLLDLGGVNPLRPWLSDIPVRVLVDTDPVFTQVKHLTDRAARDLAAQHTVFFSFGENIATERCAIPNDGLPWRPTRQPIILDAWPVTCGPAHGRFTTVMQWNSYDAVEHGAVRYEMKSGSFMPFIDLPARAGPVFELAIGSSSAPRALLTSKGWKLRDPFDVASDPWTYQQYIQESKAEFTVAKHGYVVSRSGWFSERSAGYLASGRPVVCQDTGFSDWLPSGSGVIPFTTVEDALGAVEHVQNNYEFHCRGARDLAAAYFDSDTVLRALIEEASNGDR